MYNGTMESLLDKLRQYSDSGALAMHMPGHKRNTEDFAWLAPLGARFDITEIDGFDNLNDPQELFARLEERAARLWGAKQSICLVNGSTAGVLAAIRAAVPSGGEILLARNSHKSVYHAAELADAKPHYLLPSADPQTGIFGSVSAAEVAQALDAHPNVRLVAVTSPTYEGVISDVRRIADVCHARGALLFVDEAHGAHLGFGGFPESAVRCGADLVVQSLHKTLPSLTQTAILHVNGERIDPARVRRNTVIFQSSSPSYLLSASIDGCVNYLERQGTAAAERWLAARAEFDRAAESLAHLCIWQGGQTVFAQDPSKIVVFCADADLTGRELAGIFREQFRIEVEMAHECYVVAMTGMGDTAQSLRRFADAVCAIDRTCRKGGLPRPVQPFVLPEKRLSVGEALASPGAFCPLAEAVGQVSGEYVWAYPPGIPVLVPGEVIGEGMLGEAEKLHSDRGQLPKRIFCVGNA